MHAFIALPAKYLVAQLTGHESRTLIKVSLNSFFDACVKACRYNYHEADWDAMISEIIQLNYLEMVGEGVFKVVDHETGFVDTASWYARYMEVIESLNNYYRADVIALLRKVNERGTVTSMRYIDHNVSIIQVDVTYNLLIGHEGGS
jgi:hypothetical protein